MNGSAEPDLTDDELAVLRYLEDLSRVAIQEMDRQVRRSRRLRMMQGFFQMKAPDVDVSTREAFAWIDAHWQCLSCRKFFGPDDQDCRPVCDACRAAVRGS